MRKTNSFNLNHQMNCFKSFFLQKDFHNDKHKHFNYDSNHNYVISFSGSLAMIIIILINEFIIKLINRT